jgi:nucleotide-binding universal stress UspA family protein
MLMAATYGHSPLGMLVVGSTTTAMIRTVRVPVLLVRWDGDGEPVST